MLHIIGGKHKKRKLIAPKSPSVRPTASQLREAVFNICQHQIEGARFLDLFAGSGAMGLEALSRGAVHATFVEKEPYSLVAIKKNISTLGEEAHVAVVSGDVLKVLPLLQDSFEIIFADPPYGKGLSGQLLDVIDAHLILAKEGILFIEDDSLEEPPLKRLEQKHKRSFGRATLYEYGYRTDSGDI